MNRPSLRKCIDSQCKRCVAPDKANNWKAEVENCKGYSCSLYEVRPLPAGHKHEWQLDIAEGTVQSLEQEIIEKTS